MIKLCVLIAFCLVGTALSQEHHRCVSPPFFEAHVQMYDHETGYYRDGRFSYDSIEEKVRMVEEVDRNATKPQYDELLLFGMKKRFSVDLATGKCNVTDLHEPFRHIEAGEDGQHYMGESTIGLPDHRTPGTGVLLASWNYSVNRGHTKGHGFIHLLGMIAFLSVNLSLVSKMYLQEKFNKFVFNAITTTLPLDCTILKFSTSQRLVRSCFK